MQSTVIAHKRTVGSGKALADSLGIRCITPKNTRPTSGLLINFGVGTPCDTFGYLHDGPILNPPSAVKKAVNKLLFLSEMEKAGLPTLEFTTEASMAAHWTLSSEHPWQSWVFCRGTVTGSKGEGILVTNNLPEIMSASHYPLYTRNFPKTKEYRVHVFNGQAVGMVQKRAMSEEKIVELGLGIDGPDRMIRNFERGWVFSPNLTGPENALQSIRNSCVEAAKVLGLDFAAFDVLAKGEGSKITGYALCEANTAPSLDGESSQRWYTDALSNYIKEFFV